MIAFEYEPAVLPPDHWMGQSMTPGQRQYLRVVRDSGMITPRDFITLSRAILEAYGLQPDFDRYSAEVLMDFYRNARAKNKRLAYQAAWGELPAV